MCNQSDFFIKQQDKPYDHITNAAVSELKLLIQTKIPSSLFNYKLNTLTIKKASKVSHREGSFKEDYDYDLINSWRSLTITVKIETLSFNHLGALKLNRLDIDTQKILKTGIKKKESKSRTIHY